MRVIYCILLVFCFSMSVFSQIESPNRSIKISPIKKPDAPPAPTTETTTPAIIKYESSLDKKEDKLLKGFSLLPKKEEKGIMDITDPTIRNISEVHTQKQNEKLKAEGISREVVNSDLYLGEFVVYTTELNVKCRDYGLVDGDDVRIWLNNVIIIPTVNLESGFKSYVLTLQEGQNEIRIQALNTGEAFPNTGQFVFHDENGRLVTDQNWGLNTGYNAIVKVLKRKAIDDKSDKEK